MISSGTAEVPEETGQDMDPDEKAPEDAAEEIPEEPAEAEAAEEEETEALPGPETETVTGEDESVGDNAGEEEITPETVLQDEETANSPADEAEPETPVTVPGEDPEEEELFTEEEVTEEEPALEEPFEEQSVSAEPMLASPETMIRAVDFPGITLIRKGSEMDSKYASGIKWTTKSKVSFFADPGYSYSIGNKVLRAAAYEDGQPSLGTIVAWAILPESEAASGHIGAWVSNAGVYKGDPVDIKETFYWEPVTFDSESFQPVILVGVNYTTSNLINGFRDYSGYTVRYEVYKHSDHSAPLAVDTAVMIGDIDDYQQIHLNRSDNIGQIQVTSDSRIYFAEAAGRYIGYAADYYSIDYPEDSFRAEFDAVKEFYVTYGLGVSVNIGFVNRMDPNLYFDDEKNKAIARGYRNNIESFRTLNNGDNWYGLYGVGYWNTRSYGSYTVPVPVKRASDSDEKDSVRHTVSENETFSYEIAVTIPDEYSDYFYDEFSLVDTLPDGIAYVSSGVIDDGDNDVTSKFNIVSSGQKITASLKDPKEEGFYNNSYRWVIDVCSEENIQSGTLFNSATVQVKRGQEETGRTSNKVETVIVRSLFNIDTMAVGGTIDPPVRGVRNGDTRVIRYGPSEGKVLTRLLINGEDAGFSPGQTQTVFENIQEDKSICAVFSSMPVKKVSDGEGNKINGKTIGKGSLIRYEITAFNASDRDLTCTVRDIVPKELMFISADNGGTAEESGTGTAVVWQSIVIPAGGEYTVSFTAKAISSGKVSNTAEVRYPVSDEPVKTNETVIYIPEDPVKSSASDGRVLVPGDEITYAVTAFNPYDTAKQITITDRIPEYTDFISADNGGQYSEGTVIWKIDAAAHSSVQVSLRVRAADDSGGQVLNNTAETELEGVRLTTNEVVHAVQDRPVKRVMNEEGISIDRKSVKPGEILYYTISFRNPSPEDKTYTVADRIPGGTELVTVSEPGVRKGDELIWVVEARAGMEYEVGFCVKAKEKGIAVDNTASVSTDGITLDTNNTVNAVLKDPVKRVCDKDGNDADRKISITGNELDYMISVVNPFSIRRTVVLRDILPKGAHFVSSEPEAEKEGDRLTWTLELGPGEEKTVTVRIRIKKDAEDTVLKNTASAEFDETVSSNTVMNPVQAEPRKEVLDEDGTDYENEAVYSGQILTYRIRFRNPAEEEKIYRITDRVPDGTEYIDADSGGAYDGHKVIWEVRCGAGESRAVSFRVRAAAEDTVLKNQAVIESDGVQLSTNEVVNTVPPAPEKRVTDLAGEDIENKAVFAGAALVYSVTVENPFPEDRAYHIEDILPDACRFVECSDAGREEKGTVIWDLTVPAQTAKTVTCTVTAADGNGAWESGTKIENRASVTSGKWKTKTNTVVNYIAGRPVKKVYYEDGRPADGSSVKLGDILVYEITYTNPQDAAGTVVSVIDHYPADMLEFISAGNGGVHGRDEHGNKVEWKVNAGPGESVTVSFRARVIWNDRSVINTAAAILNGSRAVSDPAVVHPLSNPVKKVTYLGNDVNGGLVLRGDTVEYTVVVKNPCDIERRFLLADDLDGSLIPEQGGSRYEAEFTLAPYEERQFTFRAALRQDTVPGSIIRNTAVLTCDGFRLDSNEVTFKAVEGPSPLYPGQDVPQYTAPPVSSGGPVWNTNTPYGRIMTGDGQKTLLWGGILGVSLLALGLWNRNRRRKRRKII
ncbi:MAG: DUF11 domain-containing protein [Lachnospiraceae bacterium]|nr:DUF11 domain-containing protein [Lachnospiraceae bacterium]